MNEIILAAIFGAIFIAELAVHHLAAKDWAKERAELLDRIQKPEMVGLPDVEIRKQYASIDDDEEAWEATREMNELNG